MICEYAIGIHVWLAGSGAAPAVTPEQVGEVDGPKAGIQVLHVHQDGKDYTAGDVLLLLYQDDRPQQQPCTPTSSSEPS